MLKNKVMLIIIVILTLLFSSSTLFLLADHSNLAIATPNAQSISISTEQYSANQTTTIDTIQVSSEDFLLEISLIIIALFSVMVSFLLKKSFENKLLIFQWDDHVDI